MEIKYVPSYRLDKHQFVQCEFQIILKGSKEWTTGGSLTKCVDGRNINNLRYANDTTLTAESEEELKSLLVKVKEESEKLA